MKPDSCHLTPTDHWSLIVDNMQECRLAAIMFTDIVGYTTLIGKDSTKALELVRINKEIQKPLVEKHNGKWLKEMGDGAKKQKITIKTPDSFISYYSFWCQSYICSVLYISARRSECYINILASISSMAGLCSRGYYGIECNVK